MTKLSLNEVLTWGKYKGKTLTEIYRIDIKYVRWLLEDGKITLSTLIQLEQLKNNDINPVLYYTEENAIEFNLMDLINERNEKIFINYLYDYIPTGEINNRAYNKEQIEISKNIIAFKKMGANAFDSFLRTMGNAILTELYTRKLFKEEVIFTVVPSSTPGKINAMQSLINNVIPYLETFGFIINNMCDKLVRIKPHTKAHLGGDRSIEGHLNTIRFMSSSSIKGRLVFLFDDIVTSGGSLSACEEILMDSGAEYVNKIVLAKTI